MTGIFLQKTLSVIYSPQPVLCWINVAYRQTKELQEKDVTQRSFLSAITVSLHNS